MKHHSLIFQHDCDYDSVVVKSESETESKMHGTFCGGTLPSLITSISNKMRVVFKTDQNTERKGFFANFVTGTPHFLIKNPVADTPEKFKNIAESN